MLQSSDEEDDLPDVNCLSGTNWKPNPVTGLNNWVPRRMCDGSSPREILNHMLPNSQIPEHLDEVFLWQIIFNLSNEPPCRKKLAEYNTLADAVNVIKKSKNIIVLTGAGVSTSSGIPDFRSRDGIYARLHQDFPDLPDPQAMFDISYFRKDPRPFFKFSKEIYPGQFQPAIGHYFIKCLEKHEKLLRNYTQNIDTLEQVAGIQRVINCHGSFASATCTNCKYQVDASVIKQDIFEQQIPRCPRCPTDSQEIAVMKPDIVFFGEGLPDTFHDAIGKDKDECDLLIVIGSSMKVRPVALIPSSIPDNIPQILINREPLGHLVFDIELLGDCDGIIQELCLRLGEDWTDICTPGAEQLTELLELPNNNETGSNMPSTDNTQAMETDEIACKDSSSRHPIGVDTVESTSDHPSGTSQVQESTSSALPADVEKVEDVRLISQDCSSTSDTNAACMLEKEVDGYESVVAEIDSPAASSDLSSIDTYDDVATMLPPTSYLYVAPSRCIFKGAEINLQTLENYKKKAARETGTVPQGGQPTVSKHITLLTSDSSNFSSAGSSIGNSSSNTSSSPDCSSIGRSPASEHSPDVRV